MRNLGPGGGWNAAVQSVLHATNLAQQFPAPLLNPSQVAGNAYIAPPFWRGVNMTPGLLADVTIATLTEHMEGHRMTSGPTFLEKQPETWPSLSSEPAEVLDADQRVSSASSLDTAPSSARPIRANSDGATWRRVRTQPFESSADPVVVRSPPTVAALSTSAKKVVAQLTARLDTLGAQHPSFSSRTERDRLKQKNFVRSVYGYDHQLTDAVVREVCNELARLGY